MDNFPVLKKLPDSSFRADDICTLCLLALVVVLAFLFTTYVGKPYVESFMTSVTGTAPVPDADKVPEVAPLGLDKCHPDCCMEVQWPVPSDISGDHATIDLTDIDKTSIHCRGCDGIGCICSKKGSDILPSYTENAHDKNK